MTKEITMAETVQMNLNVKPETKQLVERIAQLTNRKPGNTIDWLVAEAWNRIEEVHKPETSIEAAVKAPIAALDPE
jgi:hypothetical protein